MTRDGRLTLYCVIAIGVNILSIEAGLDINPGIWFYAATCLTAVILAEDHSNKRGEE